MTGAPVHRRVAATRQRSADVRTPRARRGHKALNGVLITLAWGCGGGPTLGRVTGKVTYAGKPVTQGRIWFYPEAGRAALGEIGPDGTYTLTTFKPNDGALVGPHRVAVHVTRVGA